MTDSIIDVQGLTFDYPGTRALHDVSFSIPTNSVTALIGPNGAGKTTLLRCLAALETPFSGTVRINGHETTVDARAIHRQMGFLYDFYGLHESLSVERALLHSAAVHGIASADIDASVQRACDLIGLNKYMKTEASALSRGWRQRLSIAMNIVHMPRVLLLDEPASGLDPVAREQLSEVLRTLQSEGMTIVVSSHILSELEDYSTHMMVIEDGRLGLHRAIAHDGGDADGDQRTTVRVDLSVPCPEIASVFKDTVTAEQVDDTHYRLTFDAGHTPRNVLLKALIMQGIPVSGFTVDEGSLKSNYLSHKAEGSTS